MPVAMQAQMHGGSTHTFPMERDDVYESEWDLDADESDMTHAYGMADGNQGEWDGDGMVQSSTRASHPQYALPSSAAHPTTPTPIRSRPQQPQRPLQPQLTAEEIQDAEADAAVRFHYNRKQLAELEEKWEREMGEQIEKECEGMTTDEQAEYLRKKLAKQQLQLGETFVKREETRKSVEDAEERVARLRRQLKESQERKRKELVGLPDGADESSPAATPVEKHAIAYLKFAALCEQEHELNAAHGESEMDPAVELDERLHPPRRYVKPAPLMPEALEQDPLHILHERDVLMECINKLNSMRLMAKERRMEEKMCAKIEEWPEFQELERLIEEKYWLERNFHALGCSGDPELERAYAHALDVECRSKQLDTELKHIDHEMEEMKKADAADKLETERMIAEMRQEMREDREKVEELERTRKVAEQLHAEKMRRASQQQSVAATEMSATRRTSSKRHASSTRTDRERASRPAVDADENDDDIEDDRDGDGDADEVMEVTRDQHHSQYQQQQQQQQPQPVSEKERFASMQQHLSAQRRQRQQQQRRMSQAHSLQRQSASTEGETFELDDEFGLAVQQSRQFPIVAAAANANRRRGRKRRKQTANASQY